jgi:tripartite ATP-independent transporter DctM subunit
MSIETIGIIGILALIILMFLKMPLGPLMILIGFLGIAAIKGWGPALSTLTLEPFRQSSTYILSAIPLFLLMGFIASHTGLTKDAFTAANKWLGHIRGGLAISVLGACTIFGAVCGDVIAAAVTFTTVCLPEMRKYKYKDELTLGSIALGGNLSSLIPPSIAFILYAILTEVSIGSLFTGGILPGILLAFLSVSTVLIWSRINPQIASVAPRASWRERGMSLGLMLPFILLIVLVLGGIYGGIFTPTESAAIGVFGVIVLGFAKRKLNPKMILNSLGTTARITGMILIMIIGAVMFTRFLTITEIPFALTRIVSEMSMSPLVILGVVLLFYIFLGFFMDVMVVIVLMAPILHSIFVSLGFDPIFLGVITVLTVTMGSISPPFGVVVFAISGAARDVPLFKIFRGALPFLAAMMICLILLVIFPEIVTFLPNIMR